MHYRLPATSLIALAIAAHGPAYAMIAGEPADRPIITDLVPGGDGTPATREERIAHALSTLTGGHPTIGFTGPVDQIAKRRQGYPLVPMGVAPGTVDDTPLAWAVPGMDRMTAMARVRIIGDERLGSLIGSVGGTATDSIHPGVSVFVASGQGAGFNDGGAGSLASIKNPNGGDNATLLGGSGTATVTVSGAEILARASAAATPWQATPRPEPVEPVSDPKQADAAVQTMAFTYAPLGAPSGNAGPKAEPVTRTKPLTPVARTAKSPADTVEISASFSTVITAEGIGPNSQTEFRPRPAADPARVSRDSIDLTRMNEFLEAEANGPLFRSVDPVALYRRVVADKTAPDLDRDGFEDGRRRLMPPSVAAKPAAAAEAYLNRIANLVPHYLRSPPVEAFAIGKSGPTDPSASQPLTTVVTHPITGQIMRSGGPLDNNLSFH